MISEDQASEMLKQLAEFYGEPVRRVSDYCNAFHDWSRALHEKLNDPDCSEYDREQYEWVAEALDRLVLPIYKSNYLYRRIYAGDPHLTEKCPSHKGCWSGCSYPGEECPYGCTMHGNTTGWLPLKDTE